MLIQEMILPETEFKDWNQREVLRCIVRLDSA